VIHEVGLFQGKLGFERAIVLLEKSVHEFSNILGINQIRLDFPREISKKYMVTCWPLSEESLANKTISLLTKYYHPFILPFKSDSCRFRRRHAFQSHMWLDEIMLYSLSLCE
jgi:hypothetical protein